MFMRKSRFLKEKPVSVGSFKMQSSSSKEKRIELS